MKYVYKRIIGKIDDEGGPYKVLAKKLQYLEFCSMNGIKPDDEYLKSVQNMDFKKDFDFGLCFVPEDESIDPFKYPILITPYECLKKYIKVNHNEEDYLMQYVEPGLQLCKLPTHTGFVDYWDPACLKDKNVHVYYVIMEDGPHETILVMNENDCLFLNAQNHIRYFVNIDEKLMDCTPDEGDYLFDNRKEAMQYFKKQYADDLKAKLEAFAEAEKKRLEEEEFKKHVESLGDGTYVGQMAGCKFYYQGAEYICPIAKRCSFPVDTIIDIRNGKVSFREWGTPYDEWLNKDK